MKRLHTTMARLVRAMFLMSALFILAPLSPAQASPEVTAQQPRRNAAAAGPIQHVLIIMMENKSYGQVWNSSAAPYITRLGHKYAVASGYHAITHPSLGNYLDLIGGDSYGIQRDCDPSATCHVDAVNIADELESQGMTWKAYMESMPAPCYLKPAGKYVPRHNPFLYFDDIRNQPGRCASHVRPLRALLPDLISGAAPNYAFISPNECNDMHSCPIHVGDTWLRKRVPHILNSQACTVDSCLVVITWDEGSDQGGNRVLTIFAGSAARTGGAVSSVAYDHFSLLRTVESIFGLNSLTSKDAAASPMTDLLR